MSDYRETLEALLREAVRTIRALPADRPMQFKSGMPEVVREQAESYGYDTASYRFTPSAEQIDRLDALLVWLYEAPFERPEEARYLLWGRGARVPWGVLCKRLNVSRETARKRHADAITVLGVFVWCRKRAA